MSELQSFLDEMIPLQVAAEREIHNGDVGPRTAIWSRHDPVTLLGAAIPFIDGWDRIGPAFDTVASWFTDCTSYEFELLAAAVSGDLAYTVGMEHTSCTVEGEPRSYVLRVTHVYRREEGEWRIVHRHGDTPPTDSRGRHGAARSALSSP